MQELSQFRVSLALYARLLPYVRAQSRLLSMMILAMLGTTLLTLCQPWPMQVIVDSVLGSQALHPWIAVMFAEQGKISLLATAVIAMIVVLLLRQSVVMMQGYYSQALGQRMVFTLRSDLYAKLQRLSLRFHDHNSVGDLMYRITEDAPALQDVVIHGFVPLAVQFITAVAILCAIFVLDVRLGLTAVALIPFLILWTIWFSERVRRLAHGLASAESGLCASVTEALGSIRAVKSFAVEDLELQRFQDRAQLSQDAYVRVVTWTSAGGAVTEVLAGIGTALVVLVGAFAVLRGEFSVGHLLVFMAYVQSLYGPITQLAGSALVIQRSNASIERVLEIFDQEDEHVKGGRLKPSPLRGHVLYRDVTFGYDPARPVLSHVSFEVKPGESVAFVGSSGAGKTTLLSLLLRFYDIGTGDIQLGGTDIASMDLQWLRRHIALVLQEPIIFSCSLRDNIAFGSPGASHADVVAASEAAGLHEFIMSLPDGYDTTVGERGVRLSGGQRQRLSIARAFLKNAPILILDEPTSNLDATTEKQIFHALKRLAQGRTTLYIAHRLSTAQRADRIIVLDRGRIVEQGTHAQLLSGVGVYARLYKDQIDEGDMRAQRSTLERTHAYGV